MEERPQPETTQAEGQQATTEEEEFLFEAAKDPRPSPIRAATGKCFCYCYCTKG